jgi:ADP-ribose pyrophosphatase YjhB (NUDIX family)
MYNIRVYGLLIQDNAVLVSDEFEKNMMMTKFPGGGHEVGESLPESVIREFKEELDLKIEIIEHFYTTDFYITSLFNKQQQLLSIYYLVRPIEQIKCKISTKPFDFEMISGAQSFRWIDISDLNEQNFTFPIDKKVAVMLKNTELR